jgi:hypothetical protein
MSKSKLKTELFKIEHYLQLEPRLESNVIRFGLDREKEALFIEEYSESLTFLFDDRPIGIVGLVKHAEGIGEAWALTSDEIINHGKEFNIISYQYLVEYAEFFGYTTVIARVNEDFDISHKWVEKMGFISTDRTIENPDGSNSLVYIWKGK